MPVVLTAVLAFCLVLARAHVQSISIDEATTYELFVAPLDASQWNPASNNHILNSLIMRVVIAVFGLSHLTARSGALLGALVYFTSAVVLCRAITKNEAVRCCAFICLACNPFLMDYLVAARGYALACGFLLAMLAVMARYFGGDRESPIRACAWCSALAALSVAANLAFAFACASVLILFTLAICRAGVLRALVACIVPGQLISTLLTLYAVVNWPAGQLWWGAQSLSETMQSVAEALLYEPNPQLLNPWLEGAAKALRPWILPALAAGAAIAAVSSRKDWRVRYAGLVAAGLGLAIAFHWVALRFYGTLLPKERTAIWIALFGMVVVASACAAARQKWVRSLAVASLTLSAVYFLGSLRMTYFKEWRWNAGTRQAYWTVAYYNHNFGVKQVASNWHYSAALNFYRAMSGSRDTIEPVISAVPPPPGYEMYVVHAFDRSFIEKEKLQIVYEGPGDVIVAIHPAASRAGEIRLPDSR